ncbi:MAG: FAD-dependent oxidoreductase [Planctomycetota bacterium]|nr:FAD-dependent oxidoreductase [Planctomycetota bacterium]
MSDSISMTDGLDVLDRGEALVVGGGLAGVAAALTLAEAGAETILVEERGALGWEVPHGLELFLAPNQDAPPVLRKMLDALAPKNAYRDGILDPVGLELLLDDLVQAAGVRVHFRAFASGVDAARGIVRLTTKSGPLAVQAPALVDATEDSRLARAAGARFTGSTEAAQGRALLVCAVEAPAGPERIEVDGLREVVVRPTLWPHEAHVSFVREPAEAARAESDLRFAVARAVEGLRARGGGCAQANLSLSAHETFRLRVAKLDPESLPEKFHAAGPAVLGRKPSLQERARLGVEAASAALKQPAGAQLSPAR